MHSGVFFSAVDAIDGVVERIKQEAPYWSAILPQMPRLLYQALQRQAQVTDSNQIEEQLQRQRVQNWLLIAAVLLLILISALLAASS